MKLNLAALGIVPVPVPGYGPRRSLSKGYRRIPRLNRSQKWSPATSHKHAREISPYPERPVR